MKRSRFIDKLLPFAVFVALECFALVLVVENSVVQRYRAMSFFGNVNLALWKASGTISNFMNQGRENDRLAQENLALKQRLSAFLSTDTLSNVTASKRGYTYISAKVIKNSTDRLSNWLILDAGRDCGVEEGMGVITDKGAVGIVESVSEGYCRVISFLSASQAVSAKLSGSGAFGLLSWTGTDIRKGRLSEVPTHTKVEKGDTVSTSGFSSIFPPDIPLGTAEDISSDGIHLIIDTRLFLDFSSLQYVYIVKNIDAGQIKELENVE